MSEPRATDHVTPRSTMPARQRESALRDAIRQDRVEFPRDLATRSRGRMAFHVTIPFILIALPVTLVAWLSLPWYVVVSLSFPPFLAAQRCLQTSVHDASHLLLAADRKHNDWWGNWLIAGFIGMTIENYRRIHLGHHAANGSADDPEFVDPSIVRERGGWTMFVLRYICGIEAVSLVRKYYFRKSENRPAAGRPATKTNSIFGRAPSMIHIVGCQLLLLTVFAVLADAPALYALWLYVAISWSPMLSKLRFFAEHPGADDNTVSTLASWPERLFFAPLGFNYHFEHHLWPSLPPYNLKHAHMRLRQQGFFNRHPQHLAHSFLGSLWRIARS